MDSKEQYTIYTNFLVDFFSHDIGIKIKPNKGYRLFILKRRSPALEDCEMQWEQIPNVILLIQNIKEHKKEAHMRFKLNG